MSENVFSYGIIASVDAHIGSNTSTNWQVMQDHFYETKSTLRLNYEGTLVFSDCGQLFPNSSDDIILFTDSIKVDFIKEIKKHNLFMNDDDAFYYACNWYNGSDCPLSIMTLDKFKQKFNNSKGIVW